MLELRVHAALRHSANRSWSREGRQRRRRERLDEADDEGCEEGRRPNEGGDDSEGRSPRGVNDDRDHEGSSGRSQQDAEEHGVEGPGRRERTKNETLMAMQSQLDELKEMKVLRP